jgi:colicin import membrane protein
MIFKILTGLVLATGSLVTMAQTAELNSPTLDVDAERARIAHEREASEAVYAASEQQCYSRFAVFDCLSEARQVKRIATDELRRQELVLNDMDRKNKGMEALKRIQNNVAEHQQQLEKTAQQPEAQP